MTDHDDHMDNDDQPEPMSLARFALNRAGGNHMARATAVLSGELTFADPDEQARQDEWASSYVDARAYGEPGDRPSVDLKELL